MNTSMASHLVVTPHPITLEGQRHIRRDLQPGETLRSFLARHIDIDADRWEAKIGGEVVPEKLWGLVKPKDGQVIEVRGAVNKQALYIVAMIALMYFTGGAGATGGGIFGSATGAGTFYGMAAGLGASLAAAGAFMAGPAIGGKVIA